jgi:hypothetical protein
MATNERALAYKLEFPYLHVGRYRVAFLESDTAEMERQMAWAAGKAGIGGWRTIAELGNSPMARAS